MRRRSLGIVQRLAGWAGLVLLAAVPAGGQAGGERLGLDVDQVARRVFPPRLVIAHQEEIGLSGEQRERLIREMQSTQSDLVPLQLDLAEAGRELVRTLEEPVVDEARALALTDRMLELEGRVKKRHMTLMIRIKNLLTPEQQRILYRLRRERRPGG